MDTFFYVASLIFAGTILLMMAESDRLLSFVKPKPKKVGSNSWGSYEGSHSDEPIKTIEVQPLPGKQKVIGGSTTYAAGRGVKMSGR